MRFRDRLAIAEIHAYTDLIKDLHKLIADVSISNTERSVAISETLRTMLVELAERGQFGEETGRRFLAQVEAILAQSNKELGVEVRQTIVRVASRLEPRAGFADRVKLFYVGIFLPWWENVFLPWWDDDSF